jgi:hypothetical protein
MEAVMADKIEVHFKSKGQELRAVVTPTAKFRGVLILATTEAGAAGSISKFLEDNKLTFVSAKTNLPKLPDGVSLKDKNDKDVSLTSNDDGPGVCYWVDGQLICW